MSAFANALILTGPTACGKSALALALAERIGGEILALDSMTVYRGMDIGTAKPSAAERARAQHHLIDVLDPWESLTVAWSLFAFAVFFAGLVLRERTYRIAGLITLGISIGHVFLVDVWRLDTKYRIISFLVLGVVLLILGFCYNRFRDTIRRWM